MIKKIYLIQAHQYPHQLLRMINSLQDTDVVFYIHIDLKSDLNLFTSVIKSENVFFIKDRVDCIWGDFSQVKATLNLLKSAFDGKYNNPRLTLLSGQDYPIKSKVHSSHFLENNKNISFINVEKIDEKRIHHLRNFKAFKVNHSSVKGDYTLISRFHIKHIIKSIFRGKFKLNYLKLIFIERKVPLGMKPYRGAQWWSFPFQSIFLIYKFYIENKVVLDNFYENTFCPDENFFQTILMHLVKDDKIANIRPSLTYDNWLREGVDLPVTFKLTDLKELLEQPDYKLYARKFNSKIDSLILDELDKTINNE